jgi:hypothetical protein
MRTARRHALRILVLFAWVSSGVAASGIPDRFASRQSTAPTAPAQASPASAFPIAPDQPAIQALAAKVVESIQKSGQKTVLVFDFVGPAEAANHWPEVTTFGQALASCFAAALATYASNVKVESWSQAYQTVAPDNYFPDVIHDRATGWWVAHALKRDLFVWGDLGSPTAR